MDETRNAEVADVVIRVVRWARARPDVRAVGLAGSQARGDAGPDSDVDLVVLVDDPAGLRSAAWAPAILPAGAVDIGTREWGPLAERRFRLPGGLEVELGLAPVTWAAVPVDAGTARVVADGFRVLVDPDGLLTRVVRAVAEPS